MNFISENTTVVMSLGLLFDYLEIVFDSCQLQIEESLTKNNPAFGRGKT